MCLIHWHLHGKITLIRIWIWRSKLSDLKWNPGTLPPVSWHPRHHQGFCTRKLIQPQTSWPQHWGRDCRIVKASRFLSQQWTLAGIRCGSISFERLWIPGSGWPGGWESELNFSLETWWKAWFFDTPCQVSKCVRKSLGNFQMTFLFCLLKGDCIFAVTAGGNTQWGPRGAQDWRFDSFEPKSCHRCCLKLPGLMRFPMPREYEKMHLYASFERFYLFTYFTYTCWYMHRNRTIP